MPIIQFQNVSKFYEKKGAVLDFSLEVEKGERVVILGHSGCGKTTILRLLAGFIPPDKGKILIDNEVVSIDGKILKEPEERNIGMVFQDLALWPHMTVRQNLEFGLKAKGIKKEEREKRIKHILKLTQIKEFENAKPSKLSGGQQQRVALARALVLHPKILLMDEPLSSLDFELNIKLRREILKLQKEIGFTLLYVTHNREEAFDIASRIIIMKNGKIIKEGNPEEAKIYFEQLIKRIKI